MKSLPKLSHMLLMATFLTAIAGCSSGPAVQEYPATANAEEEISKLENDIHVAESEHVDLLSPTNFKEARESLTDAKEMYSKGKKSDDTLHEVAVGRAYLDNAKAVAVTSIENTGDVIAARQAAIDEGAIDYFSKDMGKADDDFKDVTKNIEKNKIDKIAKDRKKVEDKYLALELKAIKEKNLKESRETIALAKKEKAEKYAPKTFLNAEKNYKETEAYISANRHNASEIEIRVAKTNTAAKEALAINRLARGSDKISSEEVAIALEKERQQVAAKEALLSTKEAQLSNVSGQLKKTEDELENTQNALAGSEVITSTLLSEQEKLEAEKRLNEKYDTARKEFASDEAEVYKQGDALLIRLKGMEFPSGKETITPKSKALLEKVSKVVDEFGEKSTVTIQGHTDSVGGKKVNDRLSQNRAAAVKKYLQSNEGGINVLPKKIEAVGYGYQKPLATNKTADGRAQNRRVDIVIKPDTSKE